MRMWMVPPHLLCDRHLLGEHVELHMLEGSLLRGFSISGYVEQRITQPTALHSRHEALVQEMVRRGMRHRSPLRTEPSYLLTLLDTEALLCTVDIAHSLADLASRCPDCSQRQQGGSKLLPCLRRYSK